MEHFDFVIIGSGQAGNPFASAASSKGYSVAMIEKDRIGGTCVNYGCTPTKTLVASAKVAYQARRSEEFGVNSGEISINMRKVKSRMDSKRTKWNKGSIQSLENSNVKVFRGFGSFVTNTDVKIHLNDGGETIITGNCIIINTGTRTRVPNIDGIQNIPYLDNKSILEIEEVPHHLIIIGGGYIGLEYSQIYRRFGSNVTLIHRSDQILSREDRDVSNKIQQILEEEGIKFHLSSSPLKIEKEGDTIVLSVKTSDGQIKVNGSHILLAAGRIPNSDKLNLDNIGVKTTDRGHIEVNTQFQTSIENIYALGDVKGGPAFTHVSYDDFRILKEIILDEKNDKIVGNRMIPYTLFTDPQLGRVGLSEKEAKSKEIEYRLALYDAKNVARAFESSETKGQWKVLIDKTTDQILGCSILGMEGGEVMSIIQMAMMGGITYQQLRDNIFSHPTLAESLNNVFMYGFQD